MRTIFILMQGDWSGQPPTPISAHSTRMGAINQVPEGFGLASDEIQLTRDSPYYVKEMELNP